MENMRANERKKFDPSELLTPEDRTATVAVMYNIIFLNELAVCQMFNCMNEIEESKYYRHKVKRTITHCSTGELVAV